MLEATFLKKKVEDYDDLFENHNGDQSRIIEPIIKLMFTFYGLYPEDIYAGCKCNGTPQPYLDDEKYSGQFSDEFIEYFARIRERAYWIDNKCVFQ